MADARLGGPLVTEKPAIQLSGLDLGREITVEVLGKSFTGTLRSVSHYPHLGATVGMAIQEADRVRHLDAAVANDSMVRLHGETSST